jgi:CubicO group peptidase (beta-lactamase class C family)
MVKRAFIGIGVALAVIAIWSALVLTAALQGWFASPMAPRGDARAFMDAAVKRMNSAPIGNGAIALIDDGRVFDTATRSVGDPVDAQTLFQMASVSKWVTSWGVMALVERGRIDLDAPVSKYVTRWKLPPSEYDNDGVTVRRLLSHTAGLTDGLGYRGFLPSETPQTLEESLTFATDHMPGADGRVHVGHAPGARWQYSGGGFTLLQLLIEEVTQQDFAHFMAQTVLEPLGMERSTFDEDTAVERGVATSYSFDLQPASHYRFTARAAAALYSDLDDLSRFALAHVAGNDGAAAGRGVLKPATLLEMRAPQARVFGRDLWGLGTMLYAARDDDHVFGHDGDNFPAISTAVRVDPTTRSGIVVLSSGDGAFAWQLASDWTLWKTGRVDLSGFARRLQHLQRTIGIGAGMIACAAFAWIWLGRRRAA